MKSRSLTGGTAPSSGHTLTPGTLLTGRYQIEKVVGTGGMSVVYAARDRRFRAIVRTCAVKEMHDSIADNLVRQRARENFEREANLLASLSHNAIPKVYDYFTEGDRHYLVSEFIEGQDLARFLHQRSRPMPVEKVLDWGLQLTGVLDLLHHSAPPIIFRDLKPSNVMLRPDGQIVLIDFGIAKHFQPVQRGTMIGTEGYAPPEQYEGVASPLVDVYALGATLHHLLTNTDPQEFRPFSFAQRPIPQHNPSAPTELARVIMQALAYEPEDRWANMEAFRAALQRVPVGQTIVPPPEPAPPRTQERGGSALLARLRPGAGTQPVTPLPHGTQPVAPPANPIQPVNEPPPTRMAAPAEAEETQRLPQVPWDGGTRPVSAPAREDVQPVPVLPAARILEPDEAELPIERAIVPLWTFASEDEVRSTPQLTKEALFIGSYDTNLYCLDRATGDFRWKYATNGGVPSTPAVWRDLVIVGSEDGQVYAIGRRTGKVEWTAQTQGRVRSSPRIALEHVFIGSDDGYVYALTAARGHLAWKSHLGAPVRSTAIVGEEALFIGTEDGTIAGLDWQNGAVLWRVRANGPVIASPILAGPRVVAGSMDRTLYGIDQRSGWMVWRTRLSDRVYSSPLVDEEHIFVCTVEGALYCLDAEWGKEQWRLPLGTQVTSSPALGSGNTLFIGGVDGYLYCVHRRKGRILWRFATGGAIPGSPRVWDEVVYFGSMDRRVYALPTTPAPARF